MNDTTNTAVDDEQLPDLAGPCPDWCTAPSNGGPAEPWHARWECVDHDGTEFRNHEASGLWPDVGRPGRKVSISLGAKEVRGVGLEPVHVYLYGEDGALSPNDARRLARYLVEAASKADQLNRE